MNYKDVNKLGDLINHPMNTFGHLSYNSYPNKGWALDFVKMEISVPRAWYDEFLDEVTSPDDRYRKALEHSLRVHGVKWV